MVQIDINATSCTQCGLCVLTCPERIFAREGAGAIPHTVHAEICTRCGHCVAICPEGAIAHSAVPGDHVSPIQEDLLPKSEQVMEMLRARRSLRVFQDKPVKREVLDKVIAAAALAPTAHNIMDTGYVVVQDAARLRQIVDLTADFYAKTAKLLSNPVARFAYGLFAPAKRDSAMHLMQDFDMVVEAARSGGDLFLRGAACFLACHGPDSVNFPEANAMLAVHNASLMAQALGLGCFQVGYVVGACKGSKALREVLGIPDKHQVYATLALGYPKVTFTKWIRRDPKEVTWL